MTQAFRFYVYVLARPDGTPFYVGKGGFDRPFRHDDEARRGCACRKCQAIREIWLAGGEIQRYILLATDDEAEAFALEIELIALYGRDQLVNGTDGGRGSRGATLSPETRAKIRERANARWQNPEERAKQSALKKIHAQDPAWLAQNSALRKKELADPARAAQNKAQMKALWQDPEYRARALAQRRDPEYRARRSAVLKAAAARRKAAAESEGEL